jgi:membrane protein implicated in regulation of membrane protease activity
MPRVEWKHVLYLVWTRNQAGFVFPSYSRVWIGVVLFSDLVCALLALWPPQLGGGLFFRFSVAFSYVVHIFSQRL